jgi:hypothetical protein
MKYSSPETFAQVFVSQARKIYHARNKDPGHVLRIQCSPYTLIYNIIHKALSRRRGWQVGVCSCRGGSCCELGRGGRHGRPDRVLRRDQGIEGRYTGRSCRSDTNNDTS